MDPSSLLAILLGEPERAIFLRSLADSRSSLMSAGSLVEARIVCRRRGADILVDSLEALIDAYGLLIVPFDGEQANVASDAFARYGKGTGHPAGLNFGDLFSYALAKSRGIPLLFKGQDFAQTDVEPAV